MNLVCVGVFAICFGVGFLTGDAFELKPDPVSVNLVAAPSGVAPAPAASTEAPHAGSRRLTSPEAAPNPTATPASVGSSSKQ